MKCRCCSSQNLQSALDLGMQPWGNDFIPTSETKESARYPLHVFFCSDCGMVQLDYTVAKEEMFVDHRYLSGTTKSLARHFDEVCCKILARIEFDSNDYILDVGGNDGTFLQSFAQRGLGVLNVDSGRLQAKLSQDAGIPCLNTFFNAESAAAVRAERGPAKVIHGSGVFFHLEELHSAFRGVKSLLHPQGMVVAEFIYLPGMVQSCAFDQIYHEHLLYYTIQSFAKVLAQHDLEIFDAELAPIHGGSCIAYIAHRGAKAVTPALEALVRAEIEGGFDHIEVYQEFARRTEALREKLVAMVADARAKGMRIQALGAPVKGSTIVNYCGFTEREIECAVEINEFKCGTWLPGTRIPVHHQDRVAPPDLYLMLSWNFRDEILARLADYRRAGGKVLVPVPVPEII